MTLAYTSSTRLRDTRVLPAPLDTDRPEADRLPIARTIEALTSRRWGASRRAVIVGQHDRIGEALERAERFAASGSSVLLTGETGTGKELFARGLYVMSPRSEKPFIAVNCAQYADSQLMASELFGHRRGSFTGAVADHRGVFEEANGGTVFLDEIGELSLGAQAMMLRALSEGEIVAVGDTRARLVDVRVIAATSRDLLPMVQSGRFRPDLYYRLRCLHIHVPSVRDRGDDWRLLVAHALRSLVEQGNPTKRLADETVTLLRDYSWPGNVRQLKGVVDLAFHLSPTDIIHPCHFANELEQQARDEQLSRVPITSVAQSMVDEMMAGELSFWDLVHRPYMEREINRQQVREIVALGLDHARGSYRRLLDCFGLPQADYLKFMDFLRHQRLKPQ